MYIWCGKKFETRHFENKGYGRIILKWMLGHWRWNDSGSCL